MQPLVNQVSDIARTAGAAILEIYNTDFAQCEKSDSSPLIEADLAAHHIICDSLANASEAITLTLEDEVDISHGDRKAPLYGDCYQAEVVWMHDIPMKTGKEYLFKVDIKIFYDIVESVQHRGDVNIMGHLNATELNLNEVGLVTISLNAPVVLDEYRQVSSTGSLVVIDRISNITIVSGMVRELAGGSANKSIADMSYE